VVVVPGGDDHGVDVLAVEQASVVAVEFGLRRRVIGLGLFASAVPGIADGDPLDAAGFVSGRHAVPAARAGTDDAQANAIVGGDRAQSGCCGECGSGEDSAVHEPWTPFGHGERNSATVTQSVSRCATAVVQDISIEKF
jgi:hypothetical protein